MKSVKPEKEKNVQVFVRVRPMNNNEKVAKSFAVVSCTNKEVIVKERPFEKLTKTFSFDKVFGPESKQIDVYKSVVHPLIDEVLAGYNCTVFAYGQTGTGKTFTMEGEKSNDPAISWEEDPLSGIIPRSLSHLFDELRLLQAEYTVRVSFLELYNEEIFDLLSSTDDTTKLRLFEDTARKGSVIIQGLEEVTVHNKNQVYKILEKGSLKRTTASTLMNAQSSRSHTVFSITVHIKDNSVDGEELLKTGKLNLVDLAGSENISRSGAVDKRAREAGNINQSLLTLGRCITSLVEHTPHIPYRESKLTRLLQDSLGGRTKTSIIATVSPALSNLEETLSTLDYAHRAKNITNKPEINQKLTKRALLKEYTEEIERLKRDLEATRERTGVYIAQENYSEMVLRLEQQEEEIMNKISTIKAIKEEMEKKEELLNQLNIKLDKAREIIHKTIDERDESEFLIRRHLELEEKLTVQAKELQATVDQTTNDTEKLHKKLESKKLIEDFNINASKQFMRDFNTKNFELDQKISEFDHKRSRFLELQQSLFSENLKEQEKLFSKIRSTLSSLDKFCEDLQITSLKSKEKNVRYQDMVENHRRTVDIFVDSSQKEMQSAEQIKNDLISLNCYLERLEETGLLMKDNMGRANCTLEELSSDTLQLKSTLLEVQSSLQDIAKFCFERLNMIKLTEESINENRASKNEELRDKITSFEEQMQNSLKEFTHAMLKSTTAIKSSISDKENLNERNNLIDLLSQASCKINDVNGTALTIANMVSENENFNNRLLTLKDDIVNQACHHLSEFENNVGKSKSSNQSVQLRLNEVFGKQLSTTDNYKTWSFNFFDDFSTLLKSDLQDQELRSEVNVNTLKLSTSTADNLLGTSSSMFVNFTSDRSSDFKNERSTSTAMLSEMNNIVANQSQLVQNYVNNELKSDICTGQTPPRRDFMYPRQLVEISPRERIVQRFWKDRIANYEKIDNQIDLVGTNVDNDADNDKESDNGFSEGDSANNSRESSLHKSASTGDIFYVTPSVSSTSLHSENGCTYNKKCNKGQKLCNGKPYFNRY